MLGQGNGEKMSKRELKKSLFICSVAFMMNYAAYGGLLFLQTSINVEQGLGNAGLFTIFVTSALSTIFVLPFLIDFKGAKAAIVLGEIGAIAYTVANFYPRWFTIIPAAVCHGIFESAPWAGTSVYVTRLGEQYSDLDASKAEKAKDGSMARHKESTVCRFLSIFYAFVYSSQVLGNALVSIVFRSMKSGSEQPQQQAANGSESAFTGATPTIQAKSELMRCGAAECQADFIYNSTEKELENYNPDHSAVYLLLSIFLAMQVGFTAMHVFALPNISPKKLSAGSLSSADLDMEVRRETASLKSKLRIYSSAVKLELKQTASHVISPLHVFIFPLVFYSGVFLAFTVGEFMRAYVSCSIGVEFVGFAAVVYGTSSMTTSVVSTKLLPFLGRNVCIGAMFITHICAFLFCLLWSPSSNAIGMIFICVACLGICDGMMTNIIQGMFATYFECRLAIAFSLKNFGTNLGIVAGTGWSTSFCVSSKIYILFGLIAFSAIAYVFAERLYRKSRKVYNVNSQESAAEQLRQSAAGDLA